jgi:hypothetical protein
MRRVFPLVVTAALLAAPAVSLAQRRNFNAGGVSQMGGQIMPENRNGVAAGGLYPSILWGQFTFGMSRNFDLGLRGDFYWASPLSTGPFGFGFGFSVPMRIGIAQGQKASFALKIAPDIVMGNFSDVYTGCYWYRGVHYCDGNRFYNRYNDFGFGVGLGLDFGLLVGIPVSIVNILAGVTTPFHFVFFADSNVTGIVFPIAPFGGAEVRVADNLNVLGLMQFGMSIESWEGARNVDGYFRFWAGIEYAF